MVDEVRGEKRKVRHILVKARTTPSDLTIVADRMDSILHQLRVDSLSWREAVTNFSENEQTKAVGGLMTNTKNGTTYFEKPDIDGTLILSLDRMKVGEFSDVLSFTEQDRTGEIKKGYRIIWLKTETKPHQANLQQDYAKIQAAAKGEKQQKILEQWIKLHREKNFVRVDDSMKECPQMSKWIVN
jgi:peptidyl-prolyl cis-trans isomerase SurA